VKICAKLKLTFSKSHCSHWQ